MKAYRDVQHKLIREAELLQPTRKVQCKLPFNIIEEDMADFGEAATYETVPVYLKTIDKANVTPQSVIYSGNRLVTETVPMEKLVPYYRRKHYFKYQLFGKKVRLDDAKKYLLATHFYSPGHYHWFCEVLPQLLLIKDRAKDFVLMLPDEGYLRKVAYYTLQLLDLQFSDIIFMKQKEFYKLEKVYYINNSAKAGVNDHLLQTLREQLLLKKQGGNKKFYISRQKARFRKVLNEEELGTMLAEEGYEKIFCEDLSIQNQIDLFSSACSIAGIHGAGLTNCIFMQPGSTVIELRKKENATTNIGYWYLANAMGHRYYYYNGIPDSEASIVGRGSNLSIDLAGLQHEVFASPGFRSE